MVVSYPALFIITKILYFARTKDLCVSYGSQNKRDSFPKRHHPVGLCNRDAVCSLFDTNSVVFCILFCQLHKDRETCDWGHMHPPVKEGCPVTTKTVIQILCFWTLSIVFSLSKNAVLFIFQNTTFRRLDSVSVFR
jgi:hypothetical protein